MQARNCTADAKYGVVAPASGSSRVASLQELYDERKFGVGEAPLGGKMAVCVV